MSIKLLDGSSFGHRRPFGIRAVVVREIRFKVDYSISTGLEDFGITTSGSRKELEEFIGDSPQLATESLLKGRGETKHVPVKTGRIRSTSSIELLGRGTIDEDANVETAFQLHVHQLGREASEPTQAFTSLILQRLDMYRTFAVNSNCLAGSCTTSWSGRIVQAALKMYFTTNQPFWDRYIRYCEVRIGAALGSKGQNTTWNEFSCQRC